MAHRKIRGRKLKQQKMLLLVGTFSLMMFLTVGYAAFQTTININTKGNVKRSATALNGGDVSDLENEAVTTGSGLYDNGDGSYTYKGADPYNYITFNNELWRIISISSNGQLKIIKDDKLADNRAFDSNGDTGRRTSGYCHDNASVETGCNVWSATADMDNAPSAYTNGTLTGAVSAASDLYTYLNTTYYGDSNLTDNSKIIDTTFNIGPGSTENAYTWAGKVGLLTESEFTAAGGSNSYLVRSYEYWLMNPVAQSSTNLKTINGQTVGSAAANTTKGVRPVVTLTCDISLSGKGIRTNPYIISAGDGTCSNSGGGSSSTTFVYAYHTSSKCVTDDCVTNYGYTKTVTDGVSDYTQLSSYQNGKTWFLKYEINGSNEIQNAWACQKFSFINDPVCLQGGNASYYGTSSTGNRGIIEGLATTFSSNGGYCTSASNDSRCRLNESGLHIIADSFGDVYAGDDMEYWYCEVTDIGQANCYE